jgi:hypothetical protein
MSRDPITFGDGCIPACTGAASQGASPIRDCGDMALVAAFTLASARCRAWYEYVASAQNPSDPLIRGGYNDSEVAKRIQQGDWIVAKRQSMNWDSSLRFQMWEVNVQVSALGEDTNVPQQ